MKLLQQKSYLRIIALAKLNIVIAAAIIAIGLFFSAPAVAHHPLNGGLPANFFEGIMSGLGHPVIGFDHLAFIIASGLIALGFTAGIIIPIAFVITTGIGAGVHLVSINLPIPEIVIAASVVLFGVLLVINQQKTSSNYNLMTIALAGLAGIFHGYAYGEGIFGAEPTPMIAYLIGFIIVQLAISLGTYVLASQLTKSIPFRYIARFAGGAIAACGIVFLSSAITG